jgi:hypothetical protein
MPFEVNLGFSCQQMKCAISIQGILRESADPQISMSLQQGMT